MRGRPRPLPRSVGSPRGEKRSGRSVCAASRPAAPSFATLYQATTIGGMPSIQGSATPARASCPSPAGRGSARSRSTSSGPPEFSSPSSRSASPACVGLPCAGRWRSPARRRRSGPQSLCLHPTCEAPGCTVITRSARGRPPRSPRLHPRAACPPLPSPSRMPPPPCPGTSGRCTAGTESPPAPEPVAPGGGGRGDRRGAPGGVVVRRLPSRGRPRPRSPPRPRSGSGCDSGSCRTARSTSASRPEGSGCGTGSLATTPVWPLSTILGEMVTKGGAVRVTKGVYRPVAPRGGRPGRT